MGPMDWKWLTAMLLAFSLVLSGCFGDDTDENHCDDGHVDDECPDGTTTTTTTTDQNTTTTNTTTTEANEPPTLVYTITDEAGSTTDTILVGGNLTFSAAGSSDTDGSIENIAVTVTDANRTRGETKQLYRNGQFQDATFAFPEPGRSQVFIAMVDDDSGFASENFEVYINHPQQSEPFTLRLADPVGSATDCSGTAGDDIADAQYFKAFSFETLANATFVEATVTSGAAKIAVCDPDGNPISPEGEQNVTTDQGVAFNASLDGYYVAAVSQAPNQEVSVAVVVHYEPDERAA